MDYGKIEVEIDRGAIRYVIGEGKNRRWFYDTSKIINEKEVQAWDTHLSRKNWYTPEVREKTLNLMYQLI